VTSRQGKPVALTDCCHLKEDTVCPQAALAYGCSDKKAEHLVKVCGSNHTRSCGVFLMLFYSYRPGTPAQISAILSDRTGERPTALNLRVQPAE
jgi:hypothetical protein